MIEKREYVKQKDRRFYATARGEYTTEFLKNGFENQFIEIGYTGEIEQELDQIAEGSKLWTDMLHEFYTALEERIKSRGDEDLESINLRLRNAIDELAYANEYRHIIINDSFDDAENELFGIIAQEKSNSNLVYVLMPMRV